MKDADNNEKPVSVLDASGTQDSTSQVDFLPKARFLTSGWKWIQQAISLFKEEAFFWIGFAITAFFIMFFLQSFGGFIGAFAGNFVSLLVIGLGIQMAHQQAQGEDISFSRLFDSLQKEQIIKMLWCVLVLVVISLLLFALAASIASQFLPEELMALLRESQSDPENFMQNNIQALVPYSSYLLSLFAIVFIVLLPSIFITVYAPGFIMLSDKSLKDIILLSLLGGVKNILPWLLYFVISLLLFFIASIPAMLGLIILMPILLLSCYTNFRDVFMDAPLQTSL